MLAGVLLAGVLAAPALDREVATRMASVLAGQRPLSPLFGVLDATVDPDGKVTACQAGPSKGERAVVRNLCRWLGKTRFKQMAMIDGNPAYGRFRMLLRFGSMGSSAPKVSMKPDMVFSLHKFPDGRREPYDVQVTALVSETGIISRCEGGTGAVSAYADMACARVIGASRPVNRAAGGGAVPYVEAFTARFQVDAPQNTEISK